ncbi:MAG: YbaB/EbfC family nucleoid-associated protein [Spirochaetes bacterium]|nr:YbaB/EbfC family nucleoid-associated protein [Spirochaetota bacterium]MBU0955371.1 YbaB/EbfC family nucleoid-associated protein [Spirochaetota bacterium]
MDLSDIMKMLKDPQALARQAAEMQQKVAAIVVKGSAGGGMVTVTLNGAMEMLAVEIAPEVVDPADTVMLQDLVRAAFNDASDKVKQTMQGEMARNTGLAGLGDLGGLGSMNPFGGGNS